MYEVGLFITYSMGIFQAVRKAGLKLERFKFGIYLLVPVVTVLLYSAPAIHEWYLTERRYIVYTQSDLPAIAPRRKGTRKPDTAEANDDAQPMR